ncbi:MAG: TolC family protein [Bacteroidales bacterium]|nr:TolC family protein [Bacteroidales bacterium]
MKTNYIHILILLLAGTAIPTVAGAVAQNGTTTETLTQPDIRTQTETYIYTPGSAQTTLTLEQCREMALDNNVDIVNSRLDILAAKARKKEALATYFPTVSFTAFGYYAFNPLLEIGVNDILGDNTVADLINALAPVAGIDPTYTGFKNGWNASIMATVPIYAGGRIVSGNRLAALGITAAELQSSLTERKSAEEVEQDYWQVVSLTEKAKTVDALQELLDTLQKDLNSAVEAGIAVPTDMLEIRLKQNELKATRTQLRGGITLAKMNLFNAIGFEYTPYIMNATDSLPYVGDIILTDSMELREPEAYWRDENEILYGREEAKLLDLQVESKIYEKRMTRGEVLPQLGVGAAYGYGNLVLHSNWNGAVFGTLQIPISDWGKYSHKIKRQNYELQKAQNQRDYLNDQLLLQVRQLWLNVTVAWDQAQIAEEGVEMARTTVSQLTSSYRAGLIPLSDLLKAQTDLQQNADALVDARIAYRNALTTYLNLTSEN